MKVGDRIKVIEQADRRLKPETTIGRITDIDTHKITIIKVKDGQDTFKTSFNVADLKAKGKRFFKLEDDEWKEVKFNVVNRGQPCIT